MLKYKHKIMSFNIPGFKVREFKNRNYRAIFNEATGQTIRVALNKKEPIQYLENPELLDVSFGTKCLANCFIEGTPILIYNNEEKLIENVKIGDKVKSFDESKNQFITEEVDEVFERLYEGDLFVLELENGEIIKCTPEHPFLTQRGWIEAKNLSDMDELKEMNF